MSLLSPKGAIRWHVSLLPPASFRYWGSFFELMPPRFRYLFYGGFVESSVILTERWDLGEGGLVLFRHVSSACFFEYTVFDSGFVLSRSIK